MSTTSLRSDHKIQIFLDFAGCLVCTDCLQYVCTLPQPGHKHAIRRQFVSVQWLTTLWIATIDIHQSKDNSRAFHPADFDHQTPPLCLLITISIPMSVWVSPNCWLNYTSDQPIDAALSTSTTEAGHDMGVRNTIITRRKILPFLLFVPSLHELRSHNGILCLARFSWELYGTKNRTLVVGFLLPALADKNTQITSFCR